MGNKYKRIESNSSAQVTPTRLVEPVRAIRQPQCLAAVTEMLISPTYQRTHSSQRIARIWKECERFIFLMKS
jgi:hypothetical protein